MTLICDFCKKPLDPARNKPMTIGSKTLDLHEDCFQKANDRIVEVITASPPPPPTPAPYPRVQIPPQPTLQIAQTKQKGGVWNFLSGKPKQPKEPKPVKGYTDSQSEDELARPFSP